jgi:hypothetical protein
VAPVLFSILKKNKLTALQDGTRPNQQGNSISRNFKPTKTLNKMQFGLVPSCKAVSLFFFKIENKRGATL